jgi:dihydroorotase (multifunctional complex type)
MTGVPGSQQNYRPDWDPRGSVRAVGLDIRIVGGLVVTDGTAEYRDLGIEGETIVEVGPPGSIGTAAEEIGAAGRYVLPGAVDAHFHCRAPSHPERGDFGSETRAAAAGGVTTVLEMPVSDPACSDPKVFLARRQLGERQCLVDFGLYAGGAVRDRDHAQSMAEVGAVAFKLFTHAPPSGRAREFEGLWATDEASIYRALEAVAPTGLVCTVHAENNSLMQMFTSLAADKDVPPRPPVIESVAIAMVGGMAAATGASVHIAHVTSKPALNAIRGARAAGASMTGETCPQYLVFDDAQITRLGSFAKVAPPLRPAIHQQALWGGLLDGTLAIVASDHAPFLPGEKADVDYALAPQGLPTVETMLPILMDAAARGILPLAKAAELVTAAPARLFSLYPRKGTISPGTDADIVVFDPHGVLLPGVSSLVSRAAGSGRIFDGMKLRGRIERTIVRGRTVFRDGVLADEANGQFVSPDGIVA